MSFVLFLMLYFVGTVIGYFILQGTGKVLGRRRDKKALAASRKQLETRDAEGFLIIYDPHYTRDLEEKEGIAGKKTQCDDTNCTRCHWKARYRQNLRKVYGTESMLQAKERDYVENFIPDGLSDELCDGLLADWRAEHKTALEAAKKQSEDEKFKAKIDEQTKRLERLYATPMPLIEKYKAEGRVYDQGTNTWSGPNRYRARDWESITYIDSYKHERDFNADEYKYKDDRGNTYVARNKADAKARVDRMIDEQRAARWLKEQRELTEKLNRMDQATKNFAAELKRLEAAKNHRSKVIPVKKDSWFGEWEDGW